MRWLAGDEELNDYDEHVACPPTAGVCPMNSLHTGDIDSSVAKIIFHSLRTCPRNRR